MEKQTIETIKIENPCHETWEAMTGDEQKKFCLSCNKHVHHLSAMTEKQVDKLLEEAPAICVRYSYDEEGNIITLKEKTVFERSKFIFLKAAASFIGVLIMLGLPLESLAKTVNVQGNNNSEDPSVQYLAGMPAFRSPEEIIDKNTLDSSIQSGLNNVTTPNRQPIQGNVAYPTQQQTPEMMGEIAIPKTVEPKKEPCEVKKPPKQELMGKPMMPPKQPPQTVKGKIKKPD